MAIGFQLIQKLKDTSSSVDMTTGHIRKTIVTFAIPIMIGNLFQQMYSMVDTAVVGRGVGSDALAAVGTTSPVVQLLLGLMIGSLKKRKILLLPAMIILLSLAACGNDVHQEEIMKQWADAQSSVVESKVNVPVENKFSKIEDEIVLVENAAEKSGLAAGKRDHRIA